MRDLRPTSDGGSAPRLFPARRYRRYLYIRRHARFRVQLRTRPVLHHRSKRACAYACFLFQRECARAISTVIHRYKSLPSWYFYLRAVSNPPETIRRLHLASSLFFPPSVPSVRKPKPALIERCAYQATVAASWHLRRLLLRQFRVEGTVGFPVSFIQQSLRAHFIL